MYTANKKLYEKDWFMIDYNTKYCSFLDELCKKIEENDTDIESIRKVGVMLKANDFVEKQKKDFIEILLDYYSKSKKLRAKNIFLNEAEILQKKIILKSKPRNIQVLLTNRCNLKCIICEVFSKQYTVSEKLISYIKENIPYLERIVWQGGEVFLYEKFDELMELAGKNKVFQDIITNGLLLNEERIEKLSRYNVNLNISIDAVDKETYEEIRSGGNFDILVRNLELLKKYKNINRGFQYKLGTVIINKNYEKIDDIVSFAIKYNFKTIIFQKYTPYKDKTLSLSEKQLNYTFNKIEDLKQKSEKGMIPIEICSDIVLENKEDQIVVKNENSDNGIGNDTVIENNIFHENKDCCSNVYDDINTISLEKESNLFCYAPWSIVYMLMNDEIAFSCRCRSIKPFEYEKEDIWNCKKVQEYRKNIVEKNLFECDICKEFGDNFKYSKYGML